MSARSLPQPQRVWLYAAVVVLAVVASATGLSNGFALDDLALVAYNARVHSLDQWWRLFALPYWPPQYGASLYRPLVTLAYALQWWAGGGAPWVFHLCSVVFYAGLCALVLGLLLEVLAPLPAVIGASLFAVHPVHVEAVANVVGQSELMAALAVLAACVVYVRARRTGSLGAFTGLSLCGLYGIAVLCKEHALFLPLLLAALEWFVVDAAAPAKWDALAQRARGAAPLVVGFLVVAAVYLTTRTVVLGELLGEKHLVPVHGVRRLWAMLVVAPHWLRLLVWPAHLSAEYSPGEIEIPGGPGREIAPGVTILLASVAAFIALGRASHATRTERIAARLGLAWLGITLLPVSNLFSVMLVAERTLLLPSVGAVLIAGAAVAWATTESGARLSADRRAPVAVATVVAVLVAAGAIRSRDRQRVWRDNATLFAQTAEDAPRSYRAQFFYGQLLFEQGRRAEGERRLRLAIALNPTPSDVSPLNYLATQYRDAQLCPQALPLYQRALANDEARPDVRYGMAACLLETGRVREARQLAEDGARRGVLKALFLQLIARSDSIASSGG